MSRRARHRSNKRRWHADAATLSKVMARTQPLTQAEQTSLVLPIHMSYAALRQGKAAQDDVDNLACMTNVCLVRAEDIDPILVAKTKQAQDAILRVMARHEKTNIWALDGLGMQELETCISVYEQLIALSTPAQMQDAMSAVWQRMQSGAVCETWSEK